MPFSLFVNIMRATRAGEDSGAGPHDQIVRPGGGGCEAPAAFIIRGNHLTPGLRATEINSTPAKSTAENSKEGWRVKSNNGEKRIGSPFSPLPRMCRGMRVRGSL